MWLNLMAMTVLLFSSFTATTTDQSCGEGKVCVSEELCLMVNGIDPNRTIHNDHNCPNLEKCCNVNATMSNSSVPCGIRHPLLDKQEEIEFAEFPWLVAIYRDQNYLCSGALISPLAILTSAHCVHNENVEHLRLVAGEFDAANEREPLPHQTRSASELLMHPNYTQTPASHNIAMLLVNKERPFILASHIHSICLPPSQMIYNFTQCYVAGWQRKDFGNSEILPKRTKLYALPQDQCRAKLRLAILGRRYAPTNDSLICARGDKNEFVCGDEAATSAVPLMCPLPGCMDRFVLAGVLARAGRCDGPQLLGIYTNIKFYRQWIDQKLRERNLDIKQYTVRTFNK